MPIDPASPLAEDLEFTKQLAVEAWHYALARSSNVTPEEKANRSYVTQLDKDVEAMIRHRLAERYPHDVLTGEELDAAGGSGPRRWSIDPIDGTGNLVHGLPLWAVSIGLIDHGEPVLGVIAIPTLGELYWAVKGGGAYRDDEPIRVDEIGPFHPQDNISLGTSAMRVLDPRSIPGRLRNLGSSCCEQAFLGGGRTKAMILQGEHAHDLAAGLVLVTEAGCRIGTLDGQHLGAAELIARTPVRTPTFLAPPRRLATLMERVKRFDPIDKH